MASSRSLGTLTLDLVAKTAGFVQGMNKAERSSAKWKKQVKRDVADVARRFSVLAGAVAGTLGAITVSTVRTANEISRLAQVSNSSAQEFQRYAAGSKLLGIEQDKLGDIFKDTNDKFGDFLQNGAGPLKDFFDNIAPRVGVTAESFRNLSGPQALQLYSSSLEKANLSQAEMTFYMEAVASDASMLIPLLRNGGEGFKKFGDEAERAGAILNDETLRGAQELQAAMYLLDVNATGLTNKIGGALVPVLSDFAESLADVSTNAALTDELADDLADSMKGLAATGVGAFASMQLVADGFKGLLTVREAAFKDKDWWETILPPLAAKSIYDNWGDVKDALSDVGGDMDATAQRYATILNGIWEAGEGEKPKNSRIQELADLLASMRNSTPGALAPLVDGLEQINVLAKKREVPKSIQEALDLQIEYQQLVGSLRTEEEVVLDTLRERLNLLERINTAYGEATPGQGEARSRSIAAAFGGDAPDYSGLSPEVGGAFAEFKRIEEAREALGEWYTEKLDLLRDSREQELITQDEYNALELEKAQQHQDALAEIEQARQYVALATAEETFGNLADIAKQFAGEQSDAYKVLFAFEKGVAIARSIIAIQTAIAQASASAPFPANLAAMATVAAQTASIIANIQGASIAGQAHDGLMSVPKTGTYILEKGERVVSAETTKKMDQKLDGFGADSKVNIRVVNAYDSSVMKDYMGSSDGERVIMNAVKKNQRTIKSLSS